MRYIALVTPGKFRYLQTRDWDWPLKINWKTLPCLETLYLDLKIFFRIRGLRYRAHGRANLTEGSARMKGLNLKTLVLLGLCTGAHWGDPVVKKLIRTLFQPALAVDGILEFWDDPELW
jgi:hypothetical protein